MASVVREDGGDSRVPNAEWTSRVPVFSGYGHKRPGAGGSAVDVRPVGLLRYAIEEDAGSRMRGAAPLERVAGDSGGGGH